MSEQIIDSADVVVIESEPQPFGYVTYGADGLLDGSYFQVPPEEHSQRLIAVDEDVRADWTAYRANAARDGFELLPPAPPDLASLRAAAIAATYSDVDKVTFEAVGNRAEEYKDAEAAARAYRDAGYAGAVDEMVSAYAQYNPTGVQQTNQWAADQILARAEAMQTAKVSMRTNRFESQAAMRAATTPEQLEAAVATWTAFIADVRADLGLPA